MADLPPSSEATLRTASPEGWLAWLRWLVTRGRDRLAQFGVVLVLGFAAGALALVLFAKLADDVAEQETAQLDLAVLHGLQGFTSPALDLAARGVSLLGNEVLAVVFVAVALMFALQRRWGALVALVIVTVGAQLLNDVLKEVFQRPRPTPSVGSLIPSQAFSFPSGHAMVSAAFYGFLGYMAWRGLKGLARWLVAAALLFLVLLIGLSRMYLGVHYLTDVVAGFVVGFIWTDTVILAARMISFRHQSARGAISEGSS